MTPEYEEKHEWFVHVDGSEMYGRSEEKSEAQAWGKIWKRQYPDKKVTVLHVEKFTIITRHDPVEITDA